MLILSPNALIGTASTANDQLASLPQLTPTAPTGGYPWIPNPNSEVKHSNRIRECFVFLGKLLAVAIQSCIPLPLNFPQLFWKLLVGDKPDMNDLKEIDAYCFQCLGMQFTYLRLLCTRKRTVTSFFLLAEYLMSDEIDEINFKDLIFETFTAHLSDGSEMELKPGGQSLPVTFASFHTIPLPPLCFCAYLFVNTTPGLPIGMSMCHWCLTPELTKVRNWQIKFDMA
jgi:hypothetical protein